MNNHPQPVERWPLKENLDHQARVSLQQGRPKLRGRVKAPQHLDQRKLRGSRRLVGLPYLAGLRHCRQRVFHGEQLDGLDRRGCSRGSKHHRHRCGSNGIGCLVDHDHVRWPETETIVLQGAAGRFQCRSCRGSTTPRQVYEEACGYVDDRLRRPTVLPPLPEPARKAGKCSPSPTYPQAQQPERIDIDNSKSEPIAPAIASSAIGAEIEIGRATP